MKKPSRRAQSPVATPGTSHYAQNYTNLNLNRTDGGGNYNPGPNRIMRRPEPQQVSKTSTDNCFPDLVKFRLDETEVLLTRKISSGAFGVVWLGHYHGQPVAVKRMLDGEDEALSFAREILTMSRLIHPKIVRFIGCTWTNPKDLGGVTEYMDGGDVRTLLESRKIELSWRKEKISIAIDIAEALAYMHSLNPRVIHRDLKSRNVLLNSNMVAKLSDFGLSRNRTYEETLTAGVGTVRWTAPEVMLGENYSEQADVYSFGVVLSELDTREIPFEEKSSRTGPGGAPDMAIVIKVAKGELRPSFAPDCPDVILRIAKACLQFDPALRPSSESLVEEANAFTCTYERQKTAPELYLTAFDVTILISSYDHHSASHAHTKEEGIDHADVHDMVALAGHQCVKHRYSTIPGGNMGESVDMLNVVTCIPPDQVIHEFDPHFNFRVTKYLVQNGPMELLNWFDDRAWFPLGRQVGTTVYPGLMLASAALYWLLQQLGFIVDIRHVCVFITPLFAACSCVALYSLTLEITGRTTTALLAAALISVSPGYLSRSTAGSFDNEGIAIFLLILTFYLWVKAVQRGSMLWAGATAMAYFTMAFSWGGYVFIINIIPLHVLALVVSGNYSAKVYVAYSTFYPLATLAAMQVPFIGFNAVLKGENVASHGMFMLLQVIACLHWLRAQLSLEAFTKLLRLCVFAGCGVVGVGLLAMFVLGKLQWSGRSLTLLDPTYASKYIPIIASVGEHQPTTWAGFYVALGPAILFAPLGLYYSFKYLHTGYLFMIVYSVFAFYFSGIMVRLLLTLAPAACFLSAVGIFGFVHQISLMTRISLIRQFQNEESAEPTVISSRKKELFQKKKVSIVSNKKEKEEEDKQEFAQHVIDAMTAKLQFRELPQEYAQATRKNDIPLAIGLLLIAISLLLTVHVRHSTTVSRKAHSSTSLVHEGWDPITREPVVHDDYREAYMWLRQNTPEDAKILSWWDYGYQLSSLANRTVVVDNNTWNNTHIATVGRVLTSNEDDALPILESLGVDYILILFGGYIGMRGDDLDKLPWILRIAEGVYPDDVLESEFQVKDHILFDENASIALKESLLYKFSYFDFMNVSRSSFDGRNETLGFDLNRKLSIGGSEITLKHFDQVYTSEAWIVRIYQVKPRR